MFLELFAGKGLVAGAWRQLGLGAIAFELDVASFFDLTRPCVVSLIQGWISSHCICAVWFGTPCTSWSRARRGPPGSPWCTLRSNSALDGVPGLGKRDLERVRIGNATARVTGQLIRHCIRNDVPCALENPQTSMLWSSRYISPLARSPACRELSLDFCQYGARWRKSTRVLSWNCIPWPQLCKKCSGRKGICSRTGQHHIQLTGVDKASGALWTRVAQAYPPAFARSAAKLLLDSAEHLALRKLRRLTQGF